MASEIIGINVTGADAIDRDLKCADLVAACDGFQDAGFQTWVAVDANCWPTVATVGVHLLDGCGPDASLAGDYPIRLLGYAQIADPVYGRQIADWFYDATLNVTTATYVMPAANSGQMTIVLTNCRRSGGPTGSGPLGFTGLQVMRPVTPGGPAHDFAEFWSRQFVANLKRLINPGGLPNPDAYYRDLNLSGADGAPDAMVFSAATRKLPAYAIQNDAAANHGGIYGMAMERRVQLAALVGVGLWTCIPDRATADYVQALFTVAKAGLNGLPLKYTASNETWNYAVPYSAQFTRVNAAALVEPLKDQLALPTTDPNHTTDANTLAWRWTAWFLDWLAGIGASVFGPGTLGTLHQPILNGQQQSPVILRQGLIYLASVYGSGPGTISTRIWGAGDGTYWHLALDPKDNPAAGLSPAQLIAGGIEDQAAPGQSCAFVRAADPNLWRVSYEGGWVQGDYGLGAESEAIQADPTANAPTRDALIRICETYDVVGQYDTSEISFGLYRDAFDLDAYPKVTGFLEGFAALGANGGTALVVAGVLADPGFEAVNASTPTTANQIAAAFYLQGAFVPAGYPWQFAGRAGVADANSLYLGGQGIRGLNCAILPGVGSIGQTFTLVAAGTYQLAMLVMQRALNDYANDFQVVVNGVVIDHATPTATVQTAYLSPAVALGAGTNTLLVRSLATSGQDVTVFLDNVQFISTTPIVSPTVAPGLGLPRFVRRLCRA